MSSATFPTRNPYANSSRSQVATADSGRIRLANLLRDFLRPSPATPTPWLFECHEGWCLLVFMPDPVDIS